MKIFRRLPKRFRAAVVISVIFNLLFPFSLLAEAQYRVPKNSLSYFLQNPTQSAYLETVTDEETGAVLPPLTAVETTEPARPANLVVTSANNVEPYVEPVAVEPEPAPAVEMAAVPQTDEVEDIEEIHEYVAPVPQQIKIKSVDTQLFTEAPAIEEPVKKVEVAVAPTRAPPAPKAQYKARVHMPQVSTSSSNSSLLTSTSSEEPAFSRVLARMQQNKAKRVAEAEKLGIVLPSQGGDMAAVSPSLSKIQQTLRTIMARQA